MLLGLLSLCVTYRAGISVSGSSCSYTLAAIREVYQLAFTMNVQLSAQWLSRSTDVIQRADALSRIEDRSDFDVAKSLFVKICRFRDACNRYWGFPTGDPFAGTAPEFHKAPHFFTQYPAPQGLGADALIMPWSLLDPAERTVPLLWVFPPRDLVQATIQKIALERRSAILLVHSWPQAWDVWLTHLPVVARREVGPMPGMFLTGSRFPAQLQTEGEFQRKLSCFLIRF